MPVDFPSYRRDLGPRQLLSDFVLQLRDFLEEIVHSNQDPIGRPLFLEALLGPMREAWIEARDGPLFSDILAGIERIPDSVLNTHGLSGRQLAFKLTVIRFFHARYLSLGKGILRKLIDIIDTLLKSILAAIGAGEGLAEIKDFIKDSLDD